MQNGYKKYISTKIHLTSDGSLKLAESLIIKNIKLGSQSQSHHCSSPCFLPVPHPHQLEELDPHSLPLEPEDYYFSTFNLKKIILSIIM